jgi:hypothetical protein
MESGARRAFSSEDTMVLLHIFFHHLMEKYIASAQESSEISEPPIDSRIRQNGSLLLHQDETL